MPSKNPGWKSGQIVITYAVRKHVKVGKPKNLENIKIYINIYKTLKKNIYIVLIQL